MIDIGRTTRGLRKGRRQRRRAFSTQRSKGRAPMRITLCGESKAHARCLLSFSPTKLASLTPCLNKTWIHWIKSAIISLPVLIPFSIATGGMLILPIAWGLWKPTSDILSRKKRQYRCSSKIHGGVWSLCERAVVWIDGNCFASCSKFAFLLVLRERRQHIDQGPTQNNDIEMWCLRWWYRKYEISIWVWLRWSFRRTTQCVPHST